MVMKMSQIENINSTKKIFTSCCFYYEKKFFFEKSVSGENATKPRNAGT